MSIVFFFFCKQHQTHAIYIYIYIKSNLSEKQVDMYQFQVQVTTEEREMTIWSHGLYFHHAPPFFRWTTTHHHRDRLHRGLGIWSTRFKCWWGPLSTKSTTMGLVRPRGHTQPFAINGETWRPTGLGPHVLGPSESPLATRVAGATATIHFGIWVFFFSFWSLVWRLKTNFCWRKKWR